MEVRYAYLKPEDLQKRILEYPVAYLPLGTLEWHGLHMPLGADGLQSESFFIELAQELGGVVLPMMFMGPDSKVEQDGDEFYGMDKCGELFYQEGKEYPTQRLIGSCYWMEDELFKKNILSLAKQLKRNNIKILVAHGHGPSANLFIKLKEVIEEEYQIICFNCFNPEEGYINGLQVDHGGLNETSIMMYFYNQLVDLCKLSKKEWPLAVGMGDPRDASASEGKRIVEHNLNRMKKLIYNAMEMQWK